MGNVSGKFGKNHRMSFFKPKVKASRNSEPVYQPISRSDPDEELLSRRQHLHDVRHTMSVVEEELEPPRITTGMIQGRSQHNVKVGDFEIMKVIGRGGLGKVCLVRKKSNKRLYAMKILSKEYLVKNNLISMAQSERDVLGGTAHEFLVNLHWAFQTKTKLIFVMEYCPGGELSYHLRKARRFPERVAKFYAAEIVIGLEHLHRHGIIYRDLKPENILLTAEGHIKCIDFGLSKWGITSAISGTSTLCGSLEYLAPEVLTQTGYGTAADWWSFGVLIYELLTGLPPWYDQNFREMRNRIRTEALYIPPYLSKEAKSLLSMILVLNPASRLGSRRGSSEIKHHEFFRDINWNLASHGLLEPPIRPCSTSEAVNLATNFEAESSRSSFGSIDGSVGSQGSNDEFNGFSFEAPSTLLSNMNLSTGENAIAA